MGGLGGQEREPKKRKKLKVGEILSGREGEASYSIVQKRKRKGLLRQVIRE